jgi:hypothetical protein
MALQFAPNSERGAHLKLTTGPACASGAPAPHLVDYLKSP